MTDWISVLKGLTAIALAIGTLLAAVLFMLGKLGETWRRIIKPLWNKIIKPFLKIMMVSATLMIPNGFMVGFVMYKVAMYYWEIRSLDYIITNPVVFVVLVVSQTVLASLYSFVWGILLYPKMQPWVYPRKSKAQQSPVSQQNTDIQPL